jgi:hypothetical protein
VPRRRREPGKLHADEAYDTATETKSARPPGSPVFSSVDFVADEELLADVRHALDGIAGC